MTVNLLLIGNGKWGQKYISTLCNFNNVSLSIANKNNWKSMIDCCPDGVIVCTPPQSHIEIATHALGNNIPIMIEKPLSLSLKEAEKIKKFRAPILVNHSYLFSEVYQKIKCLIKPDDITSIKSIGSNKGPVRDYSSLWDYGPHDISMILDLINKMPQKIQCTSANTDYGVMFDITMYFDTSTTISTVGNGSQEKNRIIEIDFNGMTITYDHSNYPSYYILPLTNAINTFLEAIDGNIDQRIGLELSLNVLKVLEECQRQVNIIV